jgi:division protein CdvB (Snf7/Vps24/ESCRT-III family)
MITICKNTHKVALVADKENENARQRNAKLQNAVQLLQDSYSKTFNDRTEYQVSGFLPSMLLSMNESNIIINISKAHIFI